jgi:hypothetical protein
MKKPTKKGITNQQLLTDLVQRTAGIEAYVTTLFAMQCELMAYISKSPGATIAESWGKVKLDYLNESLTELNDRLREMAK